MLENISALILIVILSERTFFWIAIVAVGGGVGCPQKVREQFLGPLISASPPAGGGWRQKGACAASFVIHSWQASNPARPIRDD